jgi:probable poly-beta-1,6-N-acetyl-D-glucosamine export protein
MVGDVTDAELLPLAAGADGANVGNSGYLTMLDLFRVVVCACVLGQHSLLWADMSNNVVGTAFITILHYTRNGFFFLSGLVVCYAQITRPRSLLRFWGRRYVQIGIPYLAWTGIYVIFTILRPGGAWNQGGVYLWSDLRLGYYQLYVIIVLFQFYLVFPFLLKLLQSTQHHALIMGISVAIALLVGADLHWNPDIGVVGHDIHQIGNAWLWSRNLISYQVYFVAGALVAFHFNQVIDFIRRWQRWILLASGAVGVTMIVWYADVIARGQSTGSASDIYEPIAVAWSFAVIAALLVVSWRWAQGRGGAAAPAVVGVRERRSGWWTSVGSGSGWSRFGRPHLPSVTYLAELTGGFYLCHILFINMIRAALYSNFIGGTHLPWPIRTLTFYVGTAVVAVAFVSLILRTPLRWVLGGPVRSEQRQRDTVEFAALRAGSGTRTARSGNGTASWARRTALNSGRGGRSHAPGQPDDSGDPDDGPVDSDHPGDPEGPTPAGPSGLLVEQRSLS